MSIPAALARRRDYSGPAIFSYGFRPFFLGGAIWAALVILLWIPLHAGTLPWRSALSPLDWHIHEMLYGYVAGHRRGLSADRDTELDRPAAGLRRAVGGTGADLACRPCGHADDGEYRRCDGGH